jgi:erythromycin esterase-like protein
MPLSPACLPARRTSGALALLLAAGCGSAPSPRRDGAPPSAVVMAVREAAHPVAGTPADYDPLMAMIGDARFVLLGEATHGTHEFYRERARITQRLIEEKGFTAVAVEGDWPDTDRVNQYVRGHGGGTTAEEALSGYTRFPAWMWRNTDVRDLVGWLRSYNDPRPTEGDVGIYGLDVYSLYTSADAVAGYLSRLDPAAAGRVREHYACFERYRPDPQRYGAAAGASVSSSCERPAAAALDELRQRAATRPADPAQAEALFSALRNAHAVVNAEEYYRTLYAGGVSTWNIRDRRMAETLDALEEHLLAATGRPAKIVVWAHNTHVGDARHTEAGEQGELNVGQLMRDRHGAAAVLVGFHTYTGQVFAAPDWDERGRVYDVRPALGGSFSDVFHAAGAGDFLLVLRDGGGVAEELAAPRLQRAIGVIYRPRTERQSHYFTARLSRQFDAVVFMDTTTAVTPLAR